TDEAVAPLGRHPFASRVPSSWYETVMSSSPLTCRASRRSLVKKSTAGSQGRGAPVTGSDQRRKTSPAPSRVNVTGSVTSIRQGVPGGPGGGDDRLARPLPKVSLGSPPGVVQVARPVPSITRTRPLPRLTSKPGSHSMPLPEVPPPLTAAG